MKGTIYVYSYPLYQKERGWYKIGKTIQGGKKRVNQQTTGMPEGATLHFEYNIEIEKESEIYDLETNIQKRFKLLDKWVQEGGGTEWFGPTNLDEINQIANEEILKLGSKELTKSYIEYSPRKCQIKGEPALRRGLEKFNKVQVSAATGTGKTILCYSIVRNTNKVVLFLAPTIQLVKQSLEEWSQFEELNSLVVCSDKDAGDDTTIVTTNPNNIEAFLSTTMSSRLNVIFATYHSAENVALAQSNVGVDFDIVFYDEAHQTVTHVDGRNHRAVLDCSIKSDKKVFVTATRKVVDHNRGITNIASMDNKSVYGELVYELTTKEAIERGWSVDFETFLIESSQKAMDRVINEIIDNSTISYSNELMKARHVSSLVCVLKAINELGSKKISTFHTFNESALKFNKLIKELKDKNLIPSDVLIRELTSKNNVEFRSEFLATTFCEADRAIISSAKWMREGVDIPCLDTIVLVDPIGTGIACQQTIGRALRIDSNNPDKVAKIIIPSFIGDTVDTSRDMTALTVLSNMYNIESGVEFEFSTVSPTGRSTMSNTTFNVIHDREIPDSRRVELNEYYSSIAMRSIGLHYGDQSNSEQVMNSIIIPGMIDWIENNIDDNELFGKRIVKEDISVYLNMLPESIINQIWTTKPSQRKQLIVSRVWESIRSEYGLVLSNTGGTGGVEGVLTRGDVFRIWCVENIKNISNYKDSYERFNNETLDWSKDNQFQIKVSLAKQIHREVIKDHGSDLQKIEFLKKSFKDVWKEAYYNVYIKHLVEDNKIKWEDWKSQYEGINTSHPARDLKEICKERGISILMKTHNQRLTESGARIKIAKEVKETNNIRKKEYLNKEVFNVINEKSWFSKDIYSKYKINGRRSRSKVSEKMFGYILDDCVKFGLMESKIQTFSTSNGGIRRKVYRKIV